MRVNRALSSMLQGSAGGGEGGGGKNMPELLCVNAELARPMTSFKTLAIFVLFFYFFVWFYPYSLPLHLFLEAGVGRK